jgi:hypothetical protein
MAKSETRKGANDEPPIWLDDKGNGLRLVRMIWSIMGDLSG